MTLVLTALMATMLVLVAALAIDGGRAYANRRQMQNAADVGAMAGTRYYAESRFADTPPATVSGLVQKVREQAGLNRSDLSADQLDCWMVDSSLDPQRLPLANPIDICDNPDTSWSAFAGAAGVEVVAAREEQTFLAQVSGIDALNARGGAIATMQPLVGVGGGSPFIVCGIGNDVESVPLILDGNQIRDEAIGKWFALQASDGGGQEPEFAGCGAGSSFDGLAGDEPIGLVPDWMDGGVGNPFSAEVLEIVLSAPECTPGVRDAEGCLLVLPIASAGRGNGTNRPKGEGVELYIVQFGIFRVWGNGTGNVPQPCADNFGNPKPKYCGQLVGQGEVSGGTGGTGEVDPNNPYLIRLVR